MSTCLTARCRRPAKKSKDPGGRLRGYFDTTPNRVNYDLGFIMSDGEWKLVGINVDLKKPDK